MGLAERRATKEFQDNQFPALLAEIHKVAGFPVPLEVIWEQLAVEGGRIADYAEDWTKVFFKPVIEGLRRIGRDQMGKDAIKSGLKKIEFRNSKGTANPNNAISMEAGVLLIDHELANIGDVEERTKVLVETVEKSL